MDIGTMFMGGVVIGFILGGLFHNFANYFSKQAKIDKELTEMEEYYYLNDTINSGWEPETKDVA